MYKNSFYRIVICTMLAMVNMQLQSMVTDTKTKQLKFQMAAEISLKVTRSCQFAGFLAGCAQQAYVAQLGLFAEHPVAGGTGIMVAWPTSVFLAYALKGYEQKVIDGLYTQQDDAIRVIFDHMYQPPPCDIKEPGREEKAAAFITTYKQMRSGEISLDAEVVAAHNNVLRRSVALKSLAQGFMYGAAVGPLPTLLVLHMLGRI